MELLIAALITFGVVTTEDASKIDQSTAEQLVEQNNLDSGKIIGLEETDF